jgi:division protein CdvB (Snf7/Vps24/ESCRT-III family)
MGEHKPSFEHHKKKVRVRYNDRAAAYLNELEGLYPIMEKIYKMTERHEILKEKVAWR